MNGENRSKAAAAREPSREPPGLGRAFLVILLMIAITAVLCVMIYGVMIAIRPIEARHYKKSAHIEKPVPDANSAGARQAPVAR